MQKMHNKEKIRVINKTTASINGKIVKGKDKRLYLYGKDINGNDYLVGELPSGTNIGGLSGITGNIPLPKIPGSIPGLGGSQGGFNLGRIRWK